MELAGYFGCKVAVLRSEFRLLTVIVSSVTVLLSNPDVELASSRMKFVDAP
jgi:hypothetical protein